jgi:uncharacterized protein (TIGR02466 family)
MMHKELWFPTQIYIKDFNIDNKKLEQDIINWSKEDIGLQKTNVNGWHSTSDMHKKEEYKPLIHELFLMQFDIFKEECLDSEPFLGNMWANINPPGAFNKPHIHPNSLWSGVYYVKTQENCGNLIIEDPKIISLMTVSKKTNETVPKHLWKEVNFEPVQGRCIMFPSWLSHAVEVNKSNDARISVSFNFLQAGMVV